MAEKTVWETFKAESINCAERIRALVREGNVRRVVVEHDGRTVAEFPLTAGVLGVALAPVLAALGALVALLKDCTIHVERASSSLSSTTPTESETTKPDRDADTAHSR